MQVVSGSIGREKVHYEAPLGRKLEMEVTLFLDWWQREADKLDGLLRSAIAGFSVVLNAPWPDLMVLLAKSYKRPVFGKSTARSQ